jgi:membrane-bound ClpP family serine protease
MPIAVALLCHPAGAYACLVTTLAAFVYAYHTHRFVPAFTAASAAALTALAFLQMPPDPVGVALVAAGAVLLQMELVLPTYGAALVTGCTAVVAGSWRLLAAAASAAPALPAALRLAIALAGTLTLLAAVLRGFRLWTLRAHLR